MLKNYFKIAWRNIKNNPFYSSLNIIGLSIGLTVGFLILIWLQNELSFNDFEGREKRIYKVNSNIKMSGEVQVWHTSPGPVAAFAKKEIPEVADAVRVATNWNYSIFSYQQEVFEADKMVYVDPGMFKMFQVKFIEGDPENPFTGNQSVVITESIAEKYFGNEPALGKTIRADQKENITISGVIEDLPENSSIDYDMLFPLSIMASWYKGDADSYWKSLDGDWGNFNYATYLEIHPDGSIEKVRDQLSAINLKNDPNAKSNKVERAYELQSVTQLNLYRPDGSPSGIQTVHIFIIVAVLILLIASINYVNLSTARSMMRAKEVSMRKIIGAKKQQLFFQFILESLLFICFSIVISFAFIFLLLPLFNGITGKTLSFNLADFAVWKMIIGVSLFIMITSSIYPAIMLSSFKPLEALKGKLSFGMGNTLFRHVLVIVQFTFSIGLIISTIVISQQMSFLGTKDPGYNRSQVLTFNAQGGMLDHMKTVKAELAKVPGVKSVSLSSGRIYNIGYTTGDVEWDGKDPDLGFVVNEIAMDESFIPMMQMQMGQGSNFTGSKADSTHYILNETAVRVMGLEDPVGKRFALHEKEGVIVGVVKDFNFFSMKFAIEPAVIRYDPAARLVNIKTSGQGAEQAIQAAQEIWDRYNSGFPFNYSFLDEGYDSLYESEQRTASLFSIFCVVAVFVSCLGLFGLATYTAKVRTKEIGIRKIVGASAFKITTLLSIGFLKLVILAVVIASPIAYFAMDKWLQEFSYRISIEWYVFAITSLVAVFIALLTISIQAVKAALANPVDSLRNE